MKTIYKYLLDETLDLPTDTKVVRVGVQDNRSYIWIELDPFAIPIFPRTYKIFGTGYDIPDTAIWQGTFEEGQFIWHVYEV